MTNLLYLAMEALHSLTIEWEAGRCPDAMYRQAVTTVRDAMPREWILVRDELTAWLFDDDPYLLTDRLEVWLLESPFHF